MHTLKIYKGAQKEFYILDYAEYAMANLREAQDFLVGVEFYAIKTKCIKQFGPDLDILFQ